MTQKNISTLVALIGVFLIGLFLGKVSPVENALKNIRAQPIRQNGFTYINPLLECEVAQELDFTELKPFKTELENLVSSQIKNGETSHVSLYFRDLTNGPWIGINEKEEFSPSSLLKVPLMISFYLQSESDPTLLQKTFLNESSSEPDASQNIPPEETLLNGSSYLGEQLIEKAIRFSDNNAARLLARNLNNEYFFRPYKDLSLKLPVIEGGEYYIRVKDYASFFRVLYNASYLNQANSEKALSFLARSTFNEGLRAGVPNDITVAHKFGERIWEDTNEHQMHDCGIVYYPGHPYLLCVMTKGKSFEALEKTISELSKLVYEKVRNNLGISE